MLNRVAVRMSLALAAVFGIAAGAAAEGPFAYHTVAPCRLHDSRVAGSPGPLLNTQSRNVAARGVCGVPATAKAVSINLTAISTHLGYLTAYPYGGTIPTNVSTLNFVGNDVIPNGAIVPLGTASPNDLGVYASVHSGGNVNFIVDVTGYFQ
jgi:hypothetical protein